MEKIVLKSKIFCANLLNSSPNGIMVIAPNTSVIYVNRAWEKLTGFRSQEVLGQKIPYPWWPEEPLNKARRIFRKAIAKGTQRNEQLFKKKDGERFWVEISGTRVQNDKIGYYMSTWVNITKFKKTMHALKSSEGALQRQQMVLKQKNIALQEILNQIEIEKKRLKNDVTINANKLLLPILRKLRGGRTPIEGKYIDMLEHNIKEIASSFGRKISEESMNLTPREIEISNLVKNGFTSKEMAEVLYISPRSIERHRYNIRKKFGITHHKINLTSFLRSF